MASQHEGERPAAPDEKKRGPRFSRAVRDVVSYTARYEELTINRHHLLRILDERDRRGEKCPRLEWCFIPLAMFLGLAVVFLTAEFKDAFGTDRAVWQAWAILVMQITGAASIGLFAWWAVDRISHALWRPLKTPDQIVDEIVGTMEAEEREFQQRHR